MSRTKGAIVADISYKKAVTRSKEMNMSIDAYIAAVQKNGLTVGPKPANNQIVAKVDFRTTLDRLVHYQTGPKSKDENNKPIKRSKADIAERIEAVVGFLKDLGYKVSAPKA